MKGVNTFEFSQATMVEAVQRYLDSIFAFGEVPTVTSVELANYDSYSKSFKIVTTMPEAPPPPMSPEEYDGR